MHITLTDVHKRFGDKEVLQGVSIAAGRGQFVALLGPSGCGKTTLLGALAGLIDIDDGVVEVEGRVLSRKGVTVKPEQRNIGMVFQDFALWPHMSVYENVAFGLRVKRTPKDELRDRVQTVLATVRMAEYADRLPHQLSGGQKQRVAIARALAPSPSVLLMDEPLSSLDAKLREDMRWELLSILQEANITTVYVTHDQTEALSMADHVVVMSQGKVLQQGSPIGLYQRPATVFTAAFLGVSNQFDGVVTAHEGDSGATVVDCGAFALEAEGAIEVGQRASVMMRPTDVELFAQDAPRIGAPGTWLSATVKQRAFHGMTWQYKAQIEGTDAVCEVWHAAEVPRGTSVRLFLPRDRCRALSTQAPQNGPESPRSGSAAIGRAATSVAGRVV
ncbi:MAG: ABC transporter ATP-binding protein [Firmicutes bacterium]|nr:ABC transporter ATP-binding protein [Bacillota bacterium]